MRLDQGFKASIGISVAVGLPLWWCIACPAVGGLAIPLVLNFLFFFVAKQICKILKIPEEDQASIFVMAVAAAMVLSLLASWPLFKFCDLQECGQQHQDLIKPVTDLFRKTGSVRV